MAGVSIRWRSIICKCRFAEWRHRGDEMSFAFLPQALDPLCVALAGTTITGSPASVSVSATVTRESSTIQYNPITGFFKFEPGIYMVGFRNVFAGYAAPADTTWNFGLND